jgi:hypothetical protein
MTEQELSPVDLDALRRAVIWGKGFQAREPQLRVMPDLMPVEASPEWTKLAVFFAATAQSENLKLSPWQCEPCRAHDDGSIDDNYFGRRTDEVMLCRKLVALGLSIYEPDPRTAIAAAEQR